MTESAERIAQAVLRGEYGAQGHKFGGNTPAGLSGMLKSRSFIISCAVAAGAAVAGGAFYLYNKHKKEHQVQVN